MPAKRKLDVLSSPGKRDAPVELGSDSDDDVMIVDPPTNGASSSKPKAELTGSKLWDSHVHLFSQLYGAVVD